jgi:hypothetical protein
MIDADYTGNVQVLLDNNSEKPFSITVGDRIAQLVLYNIQTPQVIEIAVIQDTTRGEKGFGSTGISTSPPFSTDIPPVPNVPDTPCIRTNIAPDAIEKPFEFILVTIRLTIIWKSKLQSKVTIPHWV